MSEISKNRYAFNFDGSNPSYPIGFKDLVILTSISDKFCILREICKAFGIVLESSTEYQIENE